MGQPLWLIQYGIINIEMVFVVGRLSDKKLNRQKRQRREWNCIPAQAVE
jgi:hypothetical protein